MSLHWSLLSLGNRIYFLPTLLQPSFGSSLRPLLCRVLRRSSIRLRSDFETKEFLLKTDTKSLLPPDVFFAGAAYTALDAGGRPVGSDELNKRRNDNAYINYGSDDAALGF